ncbi:unnamed protein product [Medioppia subpectinata]|uniref:Uncharacterized protein n=1 Tax=Medioppia subpectinata TaxID=1979941 RepID=A0A7R9LCA9_9ACAR|nr:unnamed protein product [Medioppia subpectinata]CAG2117695.1 unnamed protein product [Medioppia subpectinata]
MKYLLIIALAIALVSAGRVLDADFERQRSQLYARFDALEAKVESDVKHFETTILKDSPELKDLKGTETDLVDLRTRLSKMIDVVQLAPIHDRINYLENWEPAWVEHMERMLHK